MIADLKQCDRKVIRDDRGAVLHMLRCDSNEFASDFGEAYFSKIKEGVIKGWKKHIKMTQRISVPVGSVKFVFVDLRADSSSHGGIVEIELSEKNHKLIIVPPGLHYSFKGTSPGESLIANITNLPHEPSECELLPLETNEICYSWN